MFECQIIANLLFLCFFPGFNVGRPQLKRMKEEFLRGNQIVKSIISKQTEKNKSNNNCNRINNAWNNLFRKSDFFSKYVHYLQVNIIARNHDDFRTWFGLCESKLRILISGLDSQEYGIEAYPFAQFYHQNNHKTLHQQHQRKQEKTVSQQQVYHVSSAFIALKFEHGIETADLQFCTKEFLNKVNAWEGRRYGMDLTIEHKLQQHLPSFIFEKPINNSSKVVKKKDQSNSSNNNNNSHSTKANNNRTEKKKSTNNKGGKDNMTKTQNSKRNKGKEKQLKNSTNNRHSNIKISDYIIEHKITNKTTKKNEKNIEPTRQETSVKNKHNNGKSTMNRNKVSASRNSDVLTSNDNKQKKKNIHADADTSETLLKNVDTNPSPQKRQRLESSPSSSLGQ